MTLNRDERAIAGGALIVAAWFLGCVAVGVCIGFALSWVL